MGDELEPDEAGRLQEQSAAWAAERRALALLANAPHSVQALRLKLLQRGFEERAVQAALRRVEEMGYLDDRRFAEAWVASRLARHPEGASLLVAGLMKRGVSREVAEEAVQQALAPESEEEEEGARRALAKLLRSGPPDREKLLHRLTARGFRASLVIRLLDELPGGR